MNPTVRRVIILGTPAVLGILDIFHPTFSGDVFDGIGAHLDWWIILHILQLPLFCLLALSVYLLLDNVQGRWAVLAKVALGVFVAFYPAFDAILGIGGGILVNYGQGTMGIQYDMTSAIVEGYFTSNLALFVGALGGLAWALAILLAVVALARPVWSRWLVVIAAALVALAILYYQLIRLNVIPGILTINNLSRLILLLAIAVALLVRPRLAAGLLVMAAYLFSVDHAPPTGPAAMACYFVAALQLEFFPEHTPLAEPDAAPVEKKMISGEEVVASGEEVILVNEDVVPVNVLEAVGTINALGSYDHLPAKSTQTREGDANHDRT
jgi:hypothetical protein